MADVKKAIEFTLYLEDETLSGIITNRPSDAGGLTRFGLTAKYHPKLFNAGFFDANMNGETALPLAEQDYEDEYATPLLIVSIDAQTMANALLSFAVNEEGTGNRGMAVKLLQQAASAPADGVMGPNTIAIVNLCNSAVLLNAYCVLQSQHYENIVAANPSQETNLKGWLNRAKAVAAQIV